MEEDIIDMIAHYRLKVNNLHLNDTKNGKIVRNDDECSAMSQLLFDIIKKLNDRVILSSADKVYKDLVFRLLKSINP